MHLSLSTWAAPSLEYCESCCYKHGRTSICSETLLSILWGTFIYIYLILTNHLRWLGHFTFQRAVHKSSNFYTSCQHSLFSALEFLLWLWLF